MTNNPWTPGPWETDIAHPTHVWAEDCKVAKCSDVDQAPQYREPHKAEREANARLIVAAPEMAEALADMVEIVEHIERSYGGRINPPTVDNARALLARIRGE